jgi:hypothetical protein
MVLILPKRKPKEVWKRGLDYAKQYQTELIALVLIDHEDTLTSASDLAATLMYQAEQEGIRATSEIVVKHDGFDLFDYKNKYHISLMLM